MHDQIPHNVLLAADEDARWHASRIFDDHFDLPVVTLLLALAAAFCAVARVRDYDPQALFEQLADHASTPPKAH